ncbi:MAG: adenylate kinase [Euryarchaeota archaeon]|nr:adenylate kinase [Euryarchaeota archaeon]
MKLILLAPPGAGKGTQAERIAKDYAVKHTSTGDLLREAVDKATPHGLEAEKYMKKGELVPNEVVIDIMKNKLKEMDGFILDGFPRTLKQAKMLDEILKREKKPLDGVIEIHVSNREVIERITGRLSCKCGEIYHEKYNPPAAEGICDKCGGKLYKREDDREETVLSRLKTYKKKTLPLVKYYFKKGILHTVNGEQEIEDVYKEIKKVLDKIKKN